MAQHWPIDAGTHDDSLPPYIRSISNCHHIILVRSNQHYQSFITVGQFYGGIAFSSFHTNTWDQLEDDLDIVSPFGGDMWEQREAVLLALELSAEIGRGRRERGAE